MEEVKRRQAQAYTAGPESQIKTGLAAIFDKMSEDELNAMRTSAAVSRGEVSDRDEHISAARQIRGSIPRELWFGHINKLAAQVSDDPVAQKIFARGVSSNLFQQDANERTAGENWYEGLGTDTQEETVERGPYAPPQTPMGNYWLLPIYLS